MIKIESKKVPLPQISGRGRGAMYPFGDMQVGQSFFVSGKTSATLASSVSYARRKYPKWDFTTRTMDGGVRVWRTK